MRARSCFSIKMDPYRAGINIGEELADIRPEVVFLFPSIHYDGSPELVEGIYDALESEETILIGNTGDGFYERNKIADAGVSALGINSNGSVRWRVAHESGVGEAPLDAARRCMKKLNDARQFSGQVLHFMAIDFRTDTTEIISALQETASGPVVGGLAGDDYSLERCFVYVNREVLTDTVAILAMDGPLAFDIRIAHKLNPMGMPGEITETEGTTVKTIDNIPAMDFIARELGKPLETVDEGIITFKLTDRDNDEEYRIRSLFLPDDRTGDGAVKLYGGEERRSHVQVCLAPPERIIQGLKDVGASLGDLPFKPVAAIIVSCAGRKKVLADSIGGEVDEIVRGCRSLEAIAGYPSFGEFGPVKTADGFSSPLFHNMTYILLLIGEANR